MSEKQRTLANEVSLNGKGLHSGIEVIVTFKPAPLTMVINSVAQTFPVHQ